MEIEEIEVNGLENRHSDDVNVSVEESTSTITVTNGKENLPPEKKKYVKLPLNRIKHIMKMDPDCNIIQSDALFLVTKATELFLAYLSAESAKAAVVSKKKTIQRRDVDNIIEHIPHLCFLEGALE